MSINLNGDPDDALLGASLARAFAEHSLGGSEGRAMDLQAAFDAGFEAVKAYIDAEVGKIAARLAALERTR